MGLLQICEDGRRIESETARCIHCGCIWEIKSSDPTRAKLGGWCRSCADTVCPKCAELPCDNLYKQIERREARARFLREVTE